MSTQSVPPAARRLRLAILLLIFASLCLPLVASSPLAAAPASPRDYGPTPDKFLFTVGALPVPTWDNPSSVAVAPDGSIYVSNSGQGHIQRFAATGEYLGRWYIHPYTQGLRNGVGDLAVAPDGTVYVAVYANVDPMIHHYSATGEFLGQWGYLGQGAQSIPSSVALAVAHDGVVFVGDRTNQRVERYSPDGQLLGVWGSSGTGPGQFEGLRGMVVAPDGTLLITEEGNDRVQRLTVTGEVLAQWGSKGTADGQFNDPYTVAVAPDGTVYVADTLPDPGDRWTPRIQRFSHEGHFLGRWEATPRSFHDASRALTLSIVPDGSVLVADRTANRVERRSSTGAALGQVGNDPTTEGQFDILMDIAVAPDGTVFGLDYGNNRVARFAADGTYLGQWGRQGAGPGEFDAPWALAVAPDGKVYVVDRGNRRIQIFSPDGVFLEQWLDHNANDLDVAADGSVYLAAQTLLHLSPSGEVLKSFGTPAYPCSGCFYPDGVAVAPDGSIYMFNQNFARIERYSADGERLAAWDYAGGDYNALTAPARIDVAADGTVYVGGQGDGMLRRFSPDGESLGEWPAQSPMMPSLPWPLMLAVAPNGSLYVANTDSRLVEVYGPAYSPGWRNEFYANTALVGRPYGIRTTDSVAFDWGATPPDPALDPHRFSARFQRTLLLPGGVYTPTLEVQGGARLLIDDHVVIDASTAVTGTYTARVTLPDSGYRSLRVEYAARGEGAAVELRWGSGPQDRQVFLPALRHAAPPPTPSEARR